MSTKSLIAAGKVVRPKSLTDIAVEMIRAEIVEGRLAMGAQISESALAAGLGISKTPVREALFHLKLQGLVEVQPQRGTFVFQLSDEEVKEICAFREMVECAALARGIERDRHFLADSLAPILKATAAAEKAGRYADIPQLDAQFHETLVACAQSQYLRASYDLISYKIQSLRARLPEHDPEVTDCNEHHANIVDEIRSGSVLRAQKILREHIRGTQESYIAASRNHPAVTA